MPRGIPKDPNHPRNKARVDAAPAAAPKRRGRPPGSGTKKPEAQAAAAPKTKKVAAVQHAPKKSMPDQVTAALVDREDVYALRTNINVIAGAIGAAGSTPERQTLLDAQIKKLVALTDPPAADVEVEDDEPEEKPAPIIATPTPVPTLAPVPTVVSGGNNLPTPPSFMPPPFPTPNS